MAISKEAYDYLNEIERIPNWTAIPDNDERIMKLRVLFGAPVNKSYGGPKPKRIKVTKGEVVMMFDNVRQCSEVLGIKADRINNNIANNTKVYGYLFERLEE
ncbi:hypothetical protein JTF06_11995 [Desemzia sp. RIT804]|uniref:hypothetical protein n=1 Tax=Desemzia sp. RIT 804 TaxID=2810209 RepID=UPI001951280D|nr:hypothetical protein [Desemzia sp. RIT 804]MBM6615607.1 hypothetical protein [Desemzia sp. RIT 804]